MWGLHKSAAIAARNLSRLPQPLFLSRINPTDLAKQKTTEDKKDQNRSQEESAAYCNIRLDHVQLVDKETAASVPNITAIAPRTISRSSDAPGGSEQVRIKDTFLISN